MRPFRQEFFMKSNNLVRRAAIVTLALLGVAAPLQADVRPPPSKLKPKIMIESRVTIRRLQLRRATTK
jgi:hypothetical protein